MTDATVLLGPPPPLVRPRSLVLVAVGLVAALLVLQVQGALPSLLGGEGRAPAPEAAAHAARAPRIGPAREAGVLEARDPAYRALFDREGFSYQAAGAAVPLRLDLASITRGDSAVELAPGAWSTDGTVAERPVGRAVTERVTARAGEVEWDVVLSRAPAGSGDLVVRGDLAGTAGAPAVRGATIQVPVPGGPAVRIGEVVVKDAGGTVLHRALPTVTASSIELAVPAAALTGARYPVTVDPAVGSPKTLAPAGNRFEPAMAWSGGPDGTHLVVWQEFVAGQYDIYGAVISDDGVGTTQPRQLSFGSAGDFRPDVAWNGSNYLVVFEEQFAPNPSDVDILAQRVDRNGTLVGTNFGIITTTAGQGQPAITATSTGFTIAWNDNRNGNWDIYAGRFSSAGVGQDGGGTRLSNDTATSVQNEFFPDVAWNGTSTMVAWQSFDVSDYVIETGRLFADGNADFVHNGSFRLGHDFTKPAIASDGNRWLVVFEDKDKSTGAVDLLAIHLDRDNFHGGAFPVSQASGNEGDPAVAFSGNVFLVVLTDRRFPGDPDIRAIRVNTSGARLESDTFFVESSASENDVPAVSPGRASGWGVAYENGTGPATAITWRSVSK